MKWVIITIAVATMAFAAAQEMPEGEGKTLIENHCTGCHGLEPIVKLKMKRDAWEKMIIDMTGAAMDYKEIGIAADYLARHYGVPLTEEEEKTAKKFIEGVCSTCHDAQLITGTTGTKDDWLAIVKKMNDLGAGLSEQDVELLSEYLARNYGKK